MSLINKWCCMQFYGGQHLSLADFVILCAMVAVEAGVDFHNGNSTECLSTNSEGCMPKVCS